MHEFPHTDNGYLFQAGLAFYPPKEKDVTILAHTHLAAVLPQQNRIIDNHSREADWNGGELKQHLGRAGKEEKGHTKGIK